EPVDHHGLRNGPARPELPEEQQRMPAEPGREAHDGRRAAAFVASDLAVAGTGEQPMGDREQQIGTAQPVSGAEGLGAERAAAVATAETRDTPGRGLAHVVAVPAPTPVAAETVVGTIAPRAVRG